MSFIKFLQTKKYYAVVYQKHMLSELANTRIIIISSKLYESKR